MITNFQKFLFKSPFKRTTKKINCHPINFPKTENIWEKLIEIIRKNKNLQTVYLIKSKTSLVVPINLINALLSQPTCSIDDLFKTQKIVLEDGELLLNSFERQLLMQESDYFKSLWNGNFKESQLNNTINMDLPKDHLEAILELLKFSKLRNDEWQYWTMSELFSLLKRILVTRTEGGSCLMMRREPSGCTSTSWSFSTTVIGIPRPRFSSFATAAVFFNTRCRAAADSSLGFF